MHRPHLISGAFLLLLTAAPAFSRGLASDPPPQTLTYRLEPREPLKYRLVADLKGRLPIGDSPEAVDLTAKLSLTYTAIPKTRLSDGSGDVDFEVTNVDFEVLKLPFVVPDDQARDLLNLRITLARNGEVLKVHKRETEAPFSVSVPGVDPKRLYALIFPIVFQKTPVRVGDTWDYKSELLGGEGTSPRFSATLLPPAKGATATRVARLRQKFEMPVDVKKDVEKKPVARVEEAHRTQTGKIDGDGVFLFDREKGRVTRGDVNIRANITDKLVGKPESEDEPAELKTAVEAKVTIDLLNGAPATGASRAAKKEKP